MDLIAQIVDQQGLGAVGIDQRAAECAAGGITDGDDAGAILAQNGGAGGPVREGFGLHIAARLAQQGVIVFQQVIGAIAAIHHDAVAGVRHHLVAVVQQRANRQGAQHHETGLFQIRQAAIFFLGLFLVVAVFLAGIAIFRAGAGGEFLPRAAHVFLRHLAAGPLRILGRCGRQIGGGSSRFARLGVIVARVLLALLLALTRLGGGIFFVQDGAERLDRFLLGRRSAL